MIVAIHGIIFDLDGVLIHTDQYHYQAWKRLADRLEIPFDETVNNRLRGVSRMESLDIVLERYHGQPQSKTDKERLAEEKNGVYRALLGRMTPASVDPGVRETLGQLRGRGYRLAVGSSSKNARIILERVGLTDAFDAISDGTNIARSKPDPEVFLKAAEFLRLEPSQCAVVEDARSGIDAAIAAGMLPVGIGDASDYAKAAHKISTVEGLLTLFL